jgi:small-conductance mechanosensitive channel
MDGNNLLVQLGGILLTLVVTLIGIFKGLIPQLLGSFEKRLADKDTVLAQQNTALDEVCRERKELTDKFVCSLKELVIQNATSMSALTSNLSEFRKQVHDEHDEQHQNHRDILNLLQETKKPASRRSAKKAAAK